MSEQLTDESLMPFGKHAGTKLADVPAKYLLWLWDNGLHRETSRLAAYIKDAFSALESEAKDYIVQNRPK